MLTTELVCDGHVKVASLVVHVPVAALVVEGVDHVHLTAKLDQKVLGTIACVQVPVCNKRNLVMLETA